MSVMMPCTLFLISKFRFLTMTKLKCILKINMAHLALVTVMAIFLTQPSFAQEDEYQVEVIDPSNVDAVSDAIEPAIVDQFQSPPAEYVDDANAPEEQHQNAEISVQEPDNVAPSPITIINDDIVNPSQDDLASEATTQPKPKIDYNAEIPKDLFFDADNSAPQASAQQSAGPVIVTPDSSPASKYIVVSNEASKDSQKAMLVSAQRAYALGRYDAALQIYQDVLGKNENNVAALNGIAVVYQTMGEDSYAVQAYEKVLQFSPGNVEAEINLQGIIAKKYPAVALKNLTNLRQENMQNIGIVAQIAVVHANLKQYEDALRYLGIAASMEPQNPAHVYNMGVIADRIGAKNDAVKYYEQALEIDTMYGKGKALPREQIFSRLASLR